MPNQKLPKHVVDTLLANIVVLWQLCLGIVDTLYFNKHKADDAPQNRLTELMIHRRGRYYWPAERLL